MKKILFILALTLAWPSCGRLCSDQPPYIQVEAFQVIAYKDFDFILQPTDITKDNIFRITAQFHELTYVTDNGPSWNWGNNAYALSCVEPGDQGLKVKVDSIWITSDKDFHGVPVGESLNSFFQPLHEVYNNDSLRYLLEPIDFAGQTKNVNDSYTTIQDLFWVPKDHEETKEYQLFKIHVLFEDNRQLTRSTNPVKFLD